MAGGQVKAVSGRAGVCLVKSSLQKPTSPSSATQDANAWCIEGGVGQYLWGQIVTIVQNSRSKIGSQYVVLKEGLVAKKGESAFESCKSLALRDSVGQQMFILRFKKKN